MSLTEPSTGAEVDADEQRVIDAVERLLAEHPPADTPEKEFLEAQYDAGLAWVHFPEGLGGLGVSPKLQRTVIQRVSAAKGPMGGAKNPIGYGMCGPAVQVHDEDVGIAVPVAFERNGPAVSGERWGPLVEGGRGQATAPAPVGIHQVEIGLTRLLDGKHDLPAIR